MIDGHALICDLDGTLTVLDVDWAGLRARYGVETLDALWNDGIGAWSVVRESEIAAAGRAAPRDDVVAELPASAEIAILTNNSEDAARAFLARQPALAAMTRAVVGRETLRAPKTDARTFRLGFDACRKALATPAGGPVTYLGDQDYELAFAAELGATVVDARTLGIR